MTEEEILIALRMVGTQTFVAQNEEAAASVRQLGVATEETGLAMTRTARRGYLMNQAMFTVRRLMYGITLATIGAGVVAAKWGWEFNSAMQSARVALFPLRNEIGGVQNRLDKLFNFTKYTPFQFKDVTIAFRSMYFGMRTLGISADVVQLTLKSIVDVLSATGRTTPGALNRVAVALQHMAYQGVLTGQAINQLNRDGIPATAILANMFHLTGEQIHNIRQQNIPTLMFLRAINQYVQTTPGLMNAAYNQATHTLHGQFTTFKDNLSQLMGTVEIGFFHRMQDNITHMNEWFNTLNANARIGSVSGIIGAIDPGALIIWRQIAAILHIFWVDFTLIVGTLAHSKPLWATLYAGLVLLHGVLLLIDPLLQTMHYWLWLIVPLWAVYKGVQIAAAIATGANAFTTAVLSGELKTLSFFQFIAAVMVGRFTILTRIATGASWLYIAAIYAWNAAQYLLASGMIYLRAQAVLLWGILMLNPVTLIVVAVLALIVGLVILYSKWKWFHDLVNRTWNWIRGHWRDVAVALGLAFAPILVAYEALKHMHSLLHSVGQAFHRVFGGGGGNGNLNPFPGFHNGVGNGNMPHLNMPQFQHPLTPIGGFASGGVVGRSGLSWVGENGPELMALPAGATIANAGASGRIYNLAEQWMKGGNSGNGPIKIQVMINRRILGEVIAEEWALQQARQ